MRNYGPKFIVTFSVIGNTVCKARACRGSKFQRAYRGVTPGGVQRPHSQQEKGEVGQLHQQHQEMEVDKVGQFGAEKALGDAKVRSDQCPDATSKFWKAIYKVKGSAKKGAFLYGQGISFRMSPHPHLYTFRATLTMKY